MNFFKRAVLSTIRKKGKSLILLIVIFILGNLMAGSIAVRQATLNVEASIKNRLGAEAIVTYDWENPIFEDMGENTKLPTLDQKTIDKIGEMKEVKYYEYNLESALNSTEYKSYCGPDCVSGGNASNGGEYFSLYGVQYPNLIDISENKISLAEGRVFTNEEIEQGTPVTLVSTIFAEMNNIHVGDSITMTSNIFSMDSDAIAASKSFTFEVIGLFDASPTIDKNENGDPYIGYMLTQRLYLPNKAISTINDWNYAQQKEIYGLEENYADAVFPHYYLKDAKDLEGFKAEILKLLPEGFTVTISSDSYDSVAGPISFISWLSTGILYISIAATVMILGLVVILFLRDRRHEFGIYLSIGVKKWKIVIQVMLEVLMVGFIALTLSLFSGKELAGSVSQTMIDKQVINANNGGGIYYDSYLPGESVNQNEVLEAYEIKLDSGYILMLYVIGLGTLLVSSIAPTIYVVRLKPKKVLM